MGRKAKDETIKDNKRDLIINATMEMMKTESIPSISVSSIAKKAGISKGIIYYYFESKEEIIDAVFESSYSGLIEGGKRLIDNKDLNAIEKMKIMYNACIQASKALNLQADSYASYTDKQHIIHYHLQFAQSVVSNCVPVLTEILKQGNKEKLMKCEDPALMAEVIITTLTIIIDNQLMPCDIPHIAAKLRTFAVMQEKSMKIKEGSLAFLYSDAQ